MSTGKGIQDIVPVRVAPAGQVAPMLVGFTDAERELAVDMSRTTYASLTEALELVEGCRGKASPQRVEAYATAQAVDLATAARDLCMVADAAELEVHSKGAAAAKQMVEPAPPPSEGNQLHLRQPKNKAERRLVADIQAGVNARNAAMGQLARANRKVAKAHRALQQAGMILDGSEASPASVEPKGEAR